MSARARVPTRAAQLHPPAPSGTPRPPRLPRLQSPAVQPGLPLLLVSCAPHFLLGRLQLALPFLAEPTLLSTSIPLVYLPQLALTVPAGLLGPRQRGAAERVPLHERL